MKVVKVMQRMGKTIPESRVASTPSSVCSAAKQITSTTAAGTTALKKVYCTPKINFVGEYVTVSQLRQPTSLNCFCLDSRFC